MTLQIFSAYASDSEPPKTVKSWLKTKTSRPSIVPVSGHDAIAEVALLGKPEVSRPMRHEGIQLDERPGVEQQIEAFASGQLAGSMLLLDALGSAAELRLGAHLVEPIQPFFIRRHGRAPRYGTSRASCARGSVSLRTDSDDQASPVILGAPLPHSRRSRSGSARRARPSQTLSIGRDYPHFGGQLGPPVDKSRTPWRVHCASIEVGGWACATAPDRLRSSSESEPLSR